MYILLWLTIITLVTRSCPKSLGLGLLLADGAPTVGWRKVKKNDHKVVNEQCLRGLETDHWLNLGPMAKNGFSGWKPRFRAQKRLLLKWHCVLAMVGKSCAKKKVALFPNEYQSLGEFWLLFFWEKNGFLAEKILFGKTLKRPFPRNSGRDQVCCYFLRPGQSHQDSLTTVQN